MNKNIIYNKNMRIFTDEDLVDTITNYSGQHYYPHTLSDYAEVIKKYILGEIPHLPIMAVDCHDCYSCDFKCQDCLADETKHWFKNALNTFVNYEDEYEKYKISLKRISEYSAACGVNNVRFEMSGEGNPDLYPFRNEIIEYAYNLGMQPVYISSGSGINKNLSNTLVKYGSYIRISLPGITDKTYMQYSGQKRFVFADAIHLLRNLINLRKRLNRENDLLIGVRCCLRPECLDDIENVANLLINDIGIDTFQIVRAIRNVDENVFTENQSIPKEIQVKLRRLGGKKRITIPDNLETYYNVRETTDKFMGNRCFASELTPILYSNYLLPCTHTRIIKSVKSSGIDLSNGGIESNQRKADKCPTCCAIKDNTIFNNIYRVTKTIIESGKDPKFLCFD